MVRGKGESLTLSPSGEWCITGKSPVTDEARAETPKTKTNKKEY
jgi:hypothetical protein